MSCDRYAPALADHACGADLAPDVAAHLRTCAACAARLADERRAIAGLDGELQQLLAVEPSAHFATRVQAHVRAESAPRPRPFFLWSGLAAAAAVTLAAVIVYGPRGSRQIETAPAPAPATTTAKAAPLSQPAESGTTEQTTRMGASRARVADGPRRTVAATTTAASTEPEVLVPPDQARALERYVALLHGGQLETSDLAQEPAPQLSVPADLTIGPLTVKPIAIDTLEPDTRAVAEGRQDEEQTP